MSKTTEAALSATMDAVHQAGMPGLFAEIRDHDEIWRDAAGVADLETGRPMTARLRHRVGSISKTFVVAAAMKQIERGAIELDAPVGRYLPQLVPGTRGESITVRMLMSHTSGLAEYLPYAFPSLSAFPAVAETTPDSLEDHQFTRFDPLDLIALGVSAPAVATPGGAPGVYSNTNYLLLCQLIEHVTGAAAERYITETVIEPAGLLDTGFPLGPEVEGPHSRLYEAWFGMLEPARDYSVYDMSWVGPAASLISTAADLNTFFRLLLAGEVVNGRSLEEMQRTGPVISFEGTTINYGLGLHRVDMPGHGTFWGHDGSVWGGGAISLTRADGKRQMSAAVNLARPNLLDPSGKPQPHPMDGALKRFHEQALQCATDHW